MANLLQIMCAEFRIRREPPLQSLDNRAFLTIIFLGFVMQLLWNKLGYQGFCADKSLDNIIKAWVAVVLIGQWAFAIYIFSIYAMPTLFGQSEVTFSLAPGQSAKSTSVIDLSVMFAHILPAALMAMSGVLQLFPQIRTKYPKFHRYNGRMFFTLGLLGAFTGLYLTWGAGFRFSDIGSLGVTLNGILITVFIVLAWKSAVNKKFALHQRFAIHSFILVNGVWSFRLYLMGWFVINQGANGNNRTIDGPADIALSFACYLLPMAIAECVFWAKRSKSTKIKWFASGAALTGTVITAIGVGAATMLMWTPRIGKAFATLF